MHVLCTDLLLATICPIELIPSSNCFLLNNNVRSRPRGEQFLVRWAIPQLHDIDALARMADPSLKGAYPIKSLSRFADVISSCVQVRAFLWSLNYGASQEISEVLFLFWHAICPCPFPRPLNYTQPFGETECFLACKTKFPLVHQIKHFICKSFKAY